MAMANRAKPESALVLLTAFCAFPTALTQPQPDTAALPPSTWPATALSVVVLNASRSQLDSNRVPRVAQRARPPPEAPSTRSTPNSPQRD